MSDPDRSIYTSSGPTSERYSLNARGFGTHQAILSLVRTASRVLDVGCADGSLGAVMRSQRSAHVIGLETERVAAEAARIVLDDVIIGDIGQADVRGRAIELGPYDQIVLGDVLEHTTEPDVILRGLATMLDTGGSMIVSVPNVLTLRARARLLAGVWAYEDSGIFDRTHLRFFSVASARELISAAGLSITAELPVGPITHRLGRAGVRATALRPGLLATQMVFEAVPAAGALKAVPAGRPRLHGG